jgi:hypothetical protein
MLVARHIHAGIKDEVLSDDSDVSADIPTINELGPDLTFVNVVAMPPVQSKQR